jgi:predicted N-formylglutamate amidohydrolase
MQMHEVLPPPVELVNEQGTSPYVLLCEHASRFIPASYKDLGLADNELTRHIAWDIGAAALARDLSQLLDAPLVLAGYSRLLIDLNRPITSLASIPTVSELTTIPANQNISEAEREARIEAYFKPFQSTVSALLDRRQAAKQPTAIVAIHSFTPVFKGVARPWDAGILFRRSARFGRALTLALGGGAALIAENQPYQIEDDSDYTIPVHGEARGLEAVLVEVRQDLLKDSQGTASWAQRLALALQVTMQKLTTSAHSR